MKQLFMAALIFALPFAAYGQSDPNGYAVICNSTCTITLPDEQGNATQVTVSQGYVMNRIDLLPGQTLTLPPSEDIVADPTDTMVIGSIGVAIPLDATNSAAPAIVANPIITGPVIGP